MNKDAEQATPEDVTPAVLEAIINEPRTVEDTDGCPPGFYTLIAKSELDDYERFDQFEAAAEATEAEQ